jgi:hypothetical protein
VKNNKEESAALAKHASDIATMLFAALRSLNQVDPMEADIKQFVE